MYLFEWLVICVSYMGCHFTGLIEFLLAAQERDNLATMRHISRTIE